MSKSMAILTMKKHEHLDRPRPALETEEIEVTPEMIEAGVLELSLFNPREDMLEPTVLMIFEAMWRARGKDDSCHIP